MLQLSSNGSQARLYSQRMKASEGSSSSDDSSSSDEEESARLKEVVEESLGSMKGNMCTSKVNQVQT